MAISGTVAEGLAIANAAITVRDSSGTLVGSAVSASDGSYAVQPLVTAVAPMVLTATAPSGRVLTSVVATTAQPVVNITTLSDLVASLLSSNGAPQQLALDLPSDASRASTAAINQSVATINALLAPLISALSLTQTNFMNQPFAADGTGPDRLLDSLDVKIRSTGSAANIQITLRGLLDDTEDPNFLSFTNTSVPSSASYPVDVSKLIPSGESLKFGSFLTALQNCYATTPRASGTTITAAACTSLFFNADATTYLNNGRTVGLNGAWSGIFESSLTGEQFSEGRYLYSHTVNLAQGGSVLAHVFGYYIVSPSGSTGWDEITLTEENGVLVLIGDQHLYNTSATSYAQVRHFVNQPAADYYSSGTSVNVNHLIDRAGFTSGSIDHAVASSSLESFTLTAGDGYSFLGIVQNATNTAVTAPRLAGQFLSATTASQKGSPSNYATGSVWVSPAYSDAQIAAVNELMSWTVQIFLTGNSTATPDAIEYVRTLERPPTMAELAAAAPLFSSLITPAIGPITLGSGQSAFFLPPASGPLPVSWSTPVGGPLISEVGVYGTGPNAVGFNDSASFASTALQTNVTCSEELYETDLHCSSGSYSSSSTLYAVTLQTFDAENGEFQNNSVAYYLY